MLRPVPRPEGQTVVPPPPDCCWVFAGGLTHVGVRLTVIDTATGVIRAYRSPFQSAFQPVLDAAAFDTCDASFAPRASAFASPVAGNTAASSAGAGACQPDTQTLCLAGGRFEVRAHWRIPQGASGTGRVMPLTADTGAFWFFSATNPELLVKVLDACSVNGSYWVFAGGLTHVEVDLSVRDTVSGATHTYHNPAGTPFRPVQDTTNFATCGAAANTGR